jgi:nucleoside-diphosphate-sugar epimerase
VARVALIAGATGASAKRLVERLLAEPDWNVVGLSRHPPAGTPQARLSFLEADLLDANGCARALDRADAVTHLFYTARAAHGEGGSESVEANSAMFANVLEALMSVAPALEHVHLVQGGKYYGIHLGAYPTPAREDDARAAAPNFYYTQEDRLRELQRGQRWTFSISRPSFLCDFAPERSRNLPVVLGAYAAVCREMGRPLDFPGTAACWQALTEVTEATLFARAVLHLSTDPRCANRAFNVTNGDTFRWQRFWARLADRFGVPLGEARPAKLAEWMRDKDGVWQRIVERHGLSPSRLDAVASWPFADFVFGLGHDVLSSTTRLRQAGFHEVVDSEAMLLDQIARYRAARILP